MLESYLFRITQLLYVKSAMNQVAAFRPNGKNPAQVDAMITAAQAIKDLYLEKRNLRESGRAGVRVAHGEGHQAAVKVYALMKSVYAEDSHSLQLISRLPKKDFTPGQTLTRMVATSKLWAQLPNPPGQASPFSAGSLDKTTFDALTADLAAKQGDCVDCDQQFQAQEGELHETEAVSRRFITAALAQGRALFPGGAAERQVIDAIPTLPSTLPPKQVIVSIAESQAEGAVRLEFDADRATSFQVWHKGPSDAQFILVDELIRPGVYLKIALSGGNHLYKVVGVNSRGQGPASDVATVSVAQAAVA